MKQYQLFSTLIFWRFCMEQRFYSFNFFVQWLHNAFKGNVKMFFQCFLFQYHLVLSITVLYFWECWINCIGPVERVGLGIRSSDSPDPMQSRGGWSGRTVCWRLHGPIPSLTTPRPEGQPGHPINDSVKLSHLRPWEALQWLSNAFFQTGLITWLQNEIKKGEGRVDNG